MKKLVVVVVVVLLMALTACGESSLTPGEEIPGTGEQRQVSMDLRFSFLDNDRNGGQVRQAAESEGGGYSPNTLLLGGTLITGGDVYEPPNGMGDVSDKIDQNGSVSLDVSVGIGRFYHLFYRYNGVDRAEGLTIAGTELTAYCTLGSNEYDKYAVVGFKVDLDENGDLVILPNSNCYETAYKIQARLTLPSDRDILIGSNLLNRFDGSNWIVPVSNMNYDDNENAFEQSYPFVSQNQSFKIDLMMNTNEPTANNSLEPVLDNVVFEVRDLNTGELICSETPTYLMELIADSNWFGYGVMGIDPEDGGDCLIQAGDTRYQSISLGQ